MNLFLPALDDEAGVDGCRLTRRIFECDLPASKLKTNRGVWESELSDGTLSSPTSECVQSKPNLSRIFSVFLLVPTLIFPVIPAVTFSLHSHTLDTRELSGGLVCSWFGTGPEYCFFLFFFLALHTSVKHLFTAVVHFEHKQPESEADVRCGPGLITQCVSALHYFNPLCLR